MQDLVKAGGYIELKALAGIGQSDRSVTAQEELDAEGGFQLLDRHADSRLRDVELLRRFREGLQAGRGFEDEEVVGGVDQASQASHNLSLSKAIDF